MDYTESKINHLKSAINLLDEMMFMLTSQRLINRAIEKRDCLELELGIFTREARIQEG